MKSSFFLLEFANFSFKFVQWRLKGNLMDERYVFKSFRKCISALNYGLVYFKPPKWTIRKNFKDRICALYSAINILIPLKRNERNQFAFY